MIGDFTYALTRHQLEGLKYIFVGFIILAIYLTLFHVFYHFLQLGHNKAASLAYVIAVSSHFLLHRTFTFGAVGQQIMPHLWKYALMLSVNYGLLLTVIWFFVEVLYCSPYFGLIASTVLSACFNFLMMKFFVFQFKEEKQCVIS